MWPHRTTVSRLGFDEGQESLKLGWLWPDPATHARSLGRRSRWGLNSNLLFVAEGQTNREIAAEVFLSEKTAKNYVSSILGKLGLQHRA